MHDITYHYEDGGEMDEACEEHIKGLIAEGYYEGELCTIRDGDQSIETRGWWSIDIFMPND